MSCEQCRQVSVRIRSQPKAAKASIPSTLELAHMVNLGYYLEKKHQCVHAIPESRGAVIKVLDMVRFIDDRLWKVVSRSDYDGFNCTTFIKEPGRQLVIVHREAVRIGATDKITQGIVAAADWHTHQSILNHTMKLDNGRFVAKSNYRVTVTGHGIEGWMAQLSTFLRRHPAHFPVGPRGTYSFGNGTSIDLNQECNMHCVAFDSPGIDAILMRLRDEPGWLNGSAPDVVVELEELDITRYVTHPKHDDTNDTHTGCVKKIDVIMDATCGERNISMAGSPSMACHSASRVVYTGERLLIAYSSQISNTLKLRPEMSCVQCGQVSVQIRRKQKTTTAMIPTTLELAHMVNLEYYLEKKHDCVHDIPESNGAIIKVGEMVRFLDDRLWKVVSRTDYEGFNCTTFVNRPGRQIVIVHRGTLLTNWKQLVADARIALNRITREIVASADWHTQQPILNHAMKSENGRFIPRPNYTVTVTGHSLGGWLAQLSTLLRRHPAYFPVGPRGTYSFGNGMSIDMNQEFNMHCVAFDSPGAMAILERLEKEPGWLNGGPRDVAIELEKLDITVYVANPNLINKCGKHTRCVKTIDVMSEASWWNRWLNPVASHSMDGILKYFQQNPTK
ncbi:unnamed protein product, partial [Mesorhabditis spiculigera]